MRKICYLTFLSLLLLMFYSAGAQEQLKHDKVIYEDTKGSIYINKELPVYFKVSKTKDKNSEKHLLQSKYSEKYTNPMYFEKEGLNYVYSPSAVDTVTKEVIYPHKDVVFQIYVDGTAPVTKIQNNSTPYEKGDTLYFGKDVELTLNSTDVTSGVQKIYYSIDNEVFKEYSKPLSFDKEKSYILKYYSVDNVGNVETVKSVEFTIDFSKPLTNLEVIGDHKENIISGTASISLKPEDAFTGVATTYYILDDNPEKVYSKPISAKYLSEGEHTITYYSVDNVSNAEDHSVYNFFVDKTAPIIIDEIIGDSFFANGKEYSSGRSKLKLSAIDNRSGVRAIYYSLNGIDWVEYNKAFYLPNEKGQITIDFYAIDNVNNKTSAATNDIANKFFQSYIDLTGPELTFKFDGATFNYNDTVYISDKTNIILKGTDSESGMRTITYNVDQVEELEYNGSVNVSGNGLHNLDFFGFDNVNNSSQSSFFFKVDETAPEITSIFSLNSLRKVNIDSISYDVYPQHVILFLASTDNMIGVESIWYSINGLEEKQCTGYIRDFKPGKYNFSITTYDYLKNEKTSEIHFIIE